MSIETSGPAAQAAVLDATQLAEIPTPFALIDGRVLRRNIEAMQAAVEEIGASLRPHFKTHRTLAIARLQCDAGAIGVTVSTVAQLFTVGGELGPVLVSSPLHLDASVDAELQRAVAGGEVIFSIESPVSAERLRVALGPDTRAEVMIEVEVGCLRTGVPAAECGALARFAAQLGFGVVGLFSYPGHAYVPGQTAEASDQEAAALAAAASELRHAGFEPEHISAGSTPTMPFARAGVATEYRPGTYVFGDRQQLTLGAIDRGQLALTVVATVIATHDGRIVLDAGGKALGRDAPRWLPGYGELLDPSAALVSRLYDHHSVIEPYRGPAVNVGDRLSLVPNNANSAMALLQSVWLSDDGQSALELMPRADR